MTAAVAPQVQPQAQPQAPPASRGMNLRAALGVVQVGVIAIVGYKVLDALGILGSKAETRTEGFIDKIKVDETQLRHQPSAYQTIANQQYSQMTKRMLFWNVYDFGAMLQSLNGLNKDELLFVYKSYGIRKSKMFNLIKFGEAGDLIEWYQYVLDSEEIARMKAIWNITGLWPNETVPYGHKSNPNPAVADKWKEIPFNVGSVSVYPRYLHYAALGFVRDNEGKQIPYRTVKTEGYGAFGKIVQVMGSQAQNKAYFIRIRVTDPRYTNNSKYSFLKDTDMWFPTYMFNIVPPPSNVPQ